MKLCKDCKYFKPDREWTLKNDQIAHGYCTHQNAIRTISYHTGNVKYESASYMRKYKGCGTSARYYIDKDDIEPIQYNCTIFCTGCKYNQLNTDYYNTFDQKEFSLCTHPFATTFDMVTGEPQYKFASTMRHYAKKDDLKSCGENGYLFEPKDDTHAHEEETHGEEYQEYSNFTIIAFLLILLIM